MWWTKGSFTPPLAIGSSDQVLPDQRSTPDSSEWELLFGGENLLEGMRSGGRVRVGVWLDNCKCYGIEGEYFGLAQESDEFNASSGGDPILARPFVNALTGLEDAELVAYPDVIAGSVMADVNSTLHSAGARFRMNLRQQACSAAAHGGSRLDLLAGYRFLELSEGLSVREQLTSLNPIAPADFDIRDSFDARNDFHGGEIGLVYEAQRCRWSVEMLAKVALGNSHQVVTIDGRTDRTIDGEVESLTGGLLAQRTNIGRHSSDSFAVVPEAGVNLRYDLTDHLAVTVGYTVVYISEVARPGDQVDMVVNPNLLPPEVEPFTGPLRPSLDMSQTDYWAQGLNFGLLFTR